jgi:hypothetical protein
MKNNEIILFETTDHAVRLNVSTDGDTVWLSLDQLTNLFGRDKSTLSRHIKNIFTEGEPTVSIDEARRRLKEKYSNSET